MFLWQQTNQSYTRVNHQYQQPLFTVSKVCKSNIVNMLTLLVCTNFQEILSLCKLLGWIFRLIQHLLRLWISFHRKKKQITHRDSFANVHRNFFTLHKITGFTNVCTVQFFSHHMQMFGNLNLFKSTVQWNLHTMCILRISLYMETCLSWRE